MSKTIAYLKKAVILQSLFILQENKKIKKTKYESRRAIVSSQAESTIGFWSWSFTKYSRLFCSAFSSMWKSIDWK